MTITRIDCGETYSKVVIHGDTVYLTGMAAHDTSADIRGQTRQILDQIDEALAQAGTDKSKLLQVQVWLTDAVEDWAAMNEVYQAWVDPAKKPCRATVQAPLSDPAYLIEVMCIGAL